MQFVCWDCDGESDVFCLVGQVFRTENVFRLIRGAQELHSEKCQNSTCGMLLGTKSKLKSIAHISLKETLA